MTTAKKLLTAGDLLAMPDDGTRRELIQGELSKCRWPAMTMGL